MRIGLDARFFGPIGKGLGRYTERLIVHLESLDTENDYFIFLRRENFEQYQPKNPKFHKVLADYTWYGWGEQLIFPRVLDRYRLDLVHFLHFNVPFLYRKPFVVTLHDLILLEYPTVKATELPPFLYWLKYYCYRMIIASAISRARMILAVSQFTADDIAKHFSRSQGKIQVTYEATDRFCHWVEPAEVERTIGRLLGPHHDLKRPFCLYVGNAYPHKNLELLIVAAQTFPHVDFILVGKEDYFYRRLQMSVKESGVKNICFAGYVDDRSLSSFYRRARLYLFPSLYEGFGLPALEAAAHGLPVLASDHGALPEVLSDAAVYFDPRDPASFTDALASLLDSESERERLSRRGLERQAEFDWKVMTESTRDVYRKVATSQPYAV